MVYSNNLYPAKPTFKSNRESTDAGLYIAKKNASTTFCNSFACYPRNRRNGFTYEQLYLLRNASYIKKNICKPTFDSSDLNINLFTKMNLQNVCVISNTSTGACTSSINPFVNFNLNYTIDPNGVLFGNTECGVSNYENFLVPNPPSA